MKSAALAAGGAVAAAYAYRAYRRRLVSCGRKRLVNDPAEWARLQRAAQGEGTTFLAFYSSVTDAVTTVPELMSVAIHDHAVVRGHAVFDTCSLVGRRLYRLGIHLERLFASAASAKLPLPFGDDEERNRERMVEAIKAASLASGRDDADVRYWLTAGTGNLGVTPHGCRPQFYVLVYSGFPSPSNGMPEATVPESVVPFKPPVLAELKSNNYMLNALTMLAAQERGGTMGIAVDSKGFLTESCVSNVFVVGGDNVLRTPPFDGILKGTTARRILQLARAHLAGDQRLLADVRQEPIPLDRAYAATEIFLVGGDTHLLSCVSLDSRVLGDGKPGPVAAALQTLLDTDARTGEDDHEPLC